MLKGRTQYHYFLSLLDNSKNHLLHLWRHDLTESSLEKRWKSNRVRSGKKALLNQLNDTLGNGSHDNDRLVIRCIVLVDLHFSLATEFNFSGAASDVICIICIIVFLLQIPLSSEYHQHLRNRDHNLSTVWTGFVFFDGELGYFHCVRLLFAFWSEMMNQRSSLVTNVWIKWAWSVSKM